MTTVALVVDPSAIDRFIQFGTPIDIPLDIDPASYASVTPRQARSLIYEREPSYELLVDGELNPYYSRRLKPEDRPFILSLISLGMNRLAKAIACCGRQGSIDRYCSKGRYAHGNILRCHAKFCFVCGGHGARLGNWLRKRDSRRMYESQLHGFELFLPVRCAGPTDARANRDRMQALASKLLAKLDIHSVAMDQIDLHPTECRVRIASPTAFTHRAVTEAWKSIAGPGAWCVLYRDGQNSPLPCSSSVLHWLFHGLERCLKLDGGIRAHLEKQFHGVQMVRTTGEYFALLTPSELAERKAAKPSGHQCPACAERHPLEIVPFEKRCKDDRVNLEARYGEVDWTPDWAVRAIVYNNPLINASRRTYHAVGESPCPIRAGPILTV